MHARIVSHSVIFLLFIFSTQISHSSNNVSLENSTYSFDIDGDGTNETLVPDENGESINIMDSNGKIIYKVPTLVLDGYSTFDSIHKTDDGFVIINRGTNFGAYFKNEVYFKDGIFTLSKITANEEYNIDGIIYKVIHCEISPNVQLNRYSSTEIPQVLLPTTDDKFGEQCKLVITSYFKFSELESLTKDGKISWTSESTEYFLNTHKINANNVSQYNNIAYFISITEPNNPSSHHILNSILSLYPNRTVANLNMADYLSNRSRCNEAIPYYKQYIKLMKQNGLESKIPARVINYLSEMKCM
ncbi:hypothetical protein GBN24_06805 [Plesiomonas shigelloides]|uniref:tetratricopeptide repeat protein n=1 Tax=Plesiomonas shigelloides TaxID=703 RepID=UPI001262A416|nr:hypothetical protein [Plesiomonas shigelloides]KAB7691660.1 hypothetical protein GBN24_06805 [Plesiomonas shigelloides]